MANSSSTARAYPLPDEGRRVGKPVNAQRSPRSPVRRLEDIRVGLGIFPAHRVDIRPVSTQAGFHIAAFLTSAVSTSPGRSTVYRRGDVVLVDLSRPLCADITACACLTATMSRATLIDSVGEGWGQTPLRIRRDAVATKLLRRTLASFVRSEGDFGRPQGAALSAVLVSFIEDALYEGVESSDDFEAAQIRARIDLARAIRQGLEDPAFSGRDVLRSTGMTRSQLRTLLGGRALSDIIREHRVRAAQKLLRSPASRNLSITDVGRQVGFRSPAQFSTAYTLLCGAPPRSERNG